MPSLWDCDDEKHRLRVADLFPHEVVLNGEQWFTIKMKNDMGGSLDEPVVMTGVDVGGNIHLNHDIHKEIADSPTISSYVIGRRGRKSIDVIRLMAVKDEFRRHRRELEAIKYDVVITFKTDAEAVAFKLMFS